MIDNQFYHRNWRERCVLVANAIAMILINEYLLGLLRSYVFHRQNPRPPQQSIVNDSVLLIVAIGVAGLLSRLHGIPFSQFGFHDRRGASRAMAGVVTGLLCVTVTVGILCLTHLIVFDGFRLHGFEAVKFALLWGIGFACIGLYEEFLFRGYVLAALGRGIGFWPAAIALSLYFAFAHHQNQGENLLGLAGVFVAGMVLAIAVLVTKSLWWSIGSHASWNWTQAYLFGTASSGTRIHGQLMWSHPLGPAWLTGGTVGIEGSVFAIFATLAIPSLLLICRSHGRRDCLES